MKLIPYIALGLLGPLFVSSLHAQGFTSGSNGSYGPLAPPTGTTTLPLPPDGIFHCTTITIPSGATLKFTRNALNTPVYLLATGDVSISGTINVSAQAPINSVSGGQGGPGGYDGGASGYISAGVTRLAGSGLGPGGGKRGTSTTSGAGGYSTQATYQAGTRLHGPIYGSQLLIPIVGGSGGGGSDGINFGYGGGGGGALLIASTTKIVFAGGLLAANGENGGQSSGNDGSGGAVRLVAPRVFGNGSINVYGPSSTQGGHGRIRIDSIFKVDPVDPNQFLNISYNPGTAATVGANMFVFPPNNQRLDVIEAAGNVIAEGSGPVILVLPINTPTAQTIKVQARGFGAVVPIRVALIPESGDITTFDSSIDNTSTNPASVSVPVTMPINLKVEVQVWTR